MPAIAWRARRETSCSVRRRHPTWGPHKIFAWLVARERTARGRVRQQWAIELWTVDFEGQLRTRDWDWCYPLTILDHHSRYSLALQALDSTDGCGLRPVFERVFREVEMREAIQKRQRKPPFVAPARLRGLSASRVF